MNKLRKNIEMYLIFCAVCLFLAIFNLPSFYYNFLRIVVSVGAAGVAYFLISKQRYWKIIFVIIAVLFNPIFPFFLYQKSKWIPIDIIAGILFLLIKIYGIFNEIEQENEIEETTKKNKPLNTRDRIIETKYNKKKEI